VAARGFAKPFRPVNPPPLPVERGHSRTLFAFVASTTPFEPVLCRRKTFVPLSPGNGWGETHCRPLASPSHHPQVRPLKLFRPSLPSWRCQSKFRPVTVPAEKENSPEAIAFHNRAGTCFALVAGVRRASRTPATFTAVCPPTPANRRGSLCFPSHRPRVAPLKLFAVARRRGTGRRWVAVVARAWPLPITFAGERAVSKHC